MLPPNHVLPESAAAELSAVLGGVAISGAALYGLAMMIRDANGFDQKDNALMAKRLGSETDDIVTVKQLSEDSTPDSVPDTAEIAARVHEARRWISVWKEKTIGNEMELKRTEEALKKEKQEAEARARHEAEAAEAKKLEEAAEAERVARKAEEKMLAAQKLVEAKEAEIAAAMAAAKKDVQKRAQEARTWIASWKQREKANDTLSANPEMAAAVIKEMTEDTPVGVKKPSTPSPEPVMSTVKESSPDATEKEMQKAPVRRVSITTEYESKIKSLISEYESSKQRRKAMMIPKQTVTIADEELAAAEQEQASKKTNPIVLFVLRIVAMIQACFEYIKSLFTGGNSQGPHPQSA